MAQVAIVVVSYRTGDTLARCVDDAHAAAPDSAIYLVDHASRIAQLRELVSARLWIHDLSTESNPGFGAGANRGIDCAFADGASHVLLLNDDVFIRPGCVQELATAAGATGAASPWVAGEGDAVYRGGAIDWGRGFAGHREGASDYLLGGCMLISRGAWKATGPFDESFFLYCEDVDWCIRARAAGVPIVVVPRELAEHIGGASAAGETWAYWWSRNRLLLLRKHHRGSVGRTGARQILGIARGLMRDGDARIAVARTRGTVAGLIR